MYLSQNIRHLRKAKDISQKELSDRLEISSGQISKYEKGDAQPKIEMLIAMSEIFDIDVADLILKDLSREPGRPAASVPESKEEEEEMVNTLNKLLLKRVKHLEDHIKRTDPDLAERWGIE